MSRLEARYRRLLVVYPPAHRARYAEEMIGVLMDGAGSGQRRPGLRESLDLIVSGLRLRLAAGLGAGLSPAARSAAAVFGFLTAVVLAALSWYQVSASLAWGGVFEGPVRVPRESLAMGAGWTVVACLCVLGRWRLAALGASLGFLGQAAAVGYWYASAPGLLVSSWWLLILVGFASGGLVALARGGSGGAGWRGLARRDPDRLLPFGRRAIGVLAAGLVLSAVHPFGSRALTVVRSPGDGTLLVSTRFPGLMLAGPGGPYGRDLGAVVLVVVLGLLVLRLRPSVRRRVLLLTAPTVATAGLVQAGFRGFLESSPRFWPPVYPEIGQWGALVLVPLLVFATGSWLLHRYERKLASGALLA